MGLSKEKADKLDLLDTALRTGCWYLTPDIWYLVVTGWCLDNCEPETKYKY
jgi:hypothetical protein